MANPADLEAIVRKRIEDTEDQILETVDLTRQGAPRNAETDRDRLEAAIERNFRVPPPVAKIYADQSSTTQKETLGAEAIQGDTIDFVPVAYMERGLQVAKAVARIATLNSQARGTGFLCSNQLLVTNHHVIGSPTEAAARIAEFNYEISLEGGEKAVTAFRLAPERFFFTDGIDGLDVTIVALGERVRGTSPIEAFGWCGLSDSGTKHALGDFVTIIQHPRGRHKEVVLRENLIAGRHDVALHYVADTQRGSSGSPVFNSDWQPVALHHWGGTHAWSGDGNYLPSAVNEGIRISRIVKKLKAASANLDPDRLALLRDALLKGEQGFPEAFGNVPHTPPQTPVTDGAPRPRVNADGGVTWTVPLEISVNLPGFASAPTPTASTSAYSAPVASVDDSQETLTPFAGRSGYRPDFIGGTLIPLPQMTTSQRNAAARIKPEKLEPGQNDIELRYQHFSIVMNAERRLAFFTAVNIHGESLIGYSRQNKDFYDYTKASKAFAESLTGAEGDKWSDDGRIDFDEQTGGRYYESTPNKLVKANGHTNLNPKPNFDRGHLVRRLDPCWGSKTNAILAEGDTFYWTNAAPQTVAFNRGQAKGLLGEKEGRLWQGIENYILRNAWAADTKVSVFTGPVFDDKDPVYADKTGKLEIQVPLKFWKVIVWQDEDKLKSLAIVADQTQTLKKKPAGEENLAAASELELMENFLTTVAKVEKQTGLEFGDLVSKADIRFGKQDKKGSGPEDLD